MKDKIIKKHYMRICRAWKIFEKKGSFWHPIKIKTKIVALGIIISLLGLANNVKAQSPEFKKAIHNYLEITRSSTQNNQLSVSPKLENATDYLVKTSRKEIKKFIDNQEIYEAESLLKMVYGLSKAYNIGSLKDSTKVLLEEFYESEHNHEVKQAEEMFKEIELDQLKPMFIETVDIELIGKNWKIVSKNGSVDIKKTSMKILGQERFVGDREINIENEVDEITDQEIKRVIEDQAGHFPKEAKEKLFLEIKHILD